MCYISSSTNLQLVFESRSKDWQRFEIHAWKFFLFHLILQEIAKSDLNFYCEEIQNASSKENQRAGNCNFWLILLYTKAFRFFILNLTFQQLKHCYVCFLAYQKCRIEKPPVNAYLACVRRSFWIKNWCILHYL